MGMKVNGKKFCTDLQVGYSKIHGVDYDAMTDDEIKAIYSEIFPPEWFTPEFFRAYDIKIHAMARAVLEEKLIAETDYYREHMEGRSSSLNRRRKP